MGLTHMDDKGNARMVDVSGKEATVREAVAEGRVYMQTGTLRRIAEGSMPKGDVFAAARIAGIMAAKRTQELIPLCHNVPLDAVTLELSPDEDNGCVEIRSAVRCCWKTGVEMEALTAVTVAALTVYDMCKAADREMVLGDIRLLRKTGGKSGEYVRRNPEE